MKHAKHTPGPWTVGRTDVTRHLEIKNGAAVVQNEEGYAHAVMLGGPKTSEANAQLIAAAPELLEALREFLECGPNAGHNQDLIAQVKSVIAKATGGSNE